MNVFFTEAAELDLEEIGDWIAKDNPERAATFVQALRRSCLEIGPRPIAYPSVEHRRSDGIRRKVHGSYFIFCRVWLNRVEILRVLHGARDYSRMLFGGNDPD